MKTFTFLMMFSLLAFFTTAQQATFDWQETEIGNGNILQKMTVNGDIGIIAGYGNTFLKSVNSGDTWDYQSLFNPEFNLVDISIKGNVGYIVTSREKLYDASPDVYANGAILKTTDGGATWTTIESPVLGNDADPALSPSDTLGFGYDFQSIETVDDNIAFCGLRWYEYTPSGNDVHAGVFKTTDGGATWVNVSGDLNNSVATTITFHGNNGFVGGNKLLYKATASGNSLVDIFANMPGDGSDYISDIELIDNDELYVITISDSIYYSSDGGDNFDKFKGVKGGWDILKVNNTTFVVAGSSNKSYISTDTGQTWTSLGISTSIWEIAGIVNDSINMLAKAAIYKCATADLLAGNYNFVKQTVGTANLQKASVNGDDLIVVGNDAGFFNTSDAGLTWASVSLPDNPMLNAMLDEMDFSGLSNVGDDAYVCFNRHKFVNYPTSSDKHDIYWSGGVFYTDDNWETYNDFDIAKVGKAYADDVTKNPNHASCNGVNTAVIELMDDGAVLLWIRWYDISGDSKVEHSRVFKTIDNGKNWTAITDDFLKSYVQAIESTGNTIYVVGKEILLKSINGGDEFTDLYPILDEGEDDNMYINMVRLGDADEVFLTTYADSIFRTTDGGSTFKTIANIKGSSDSYKLGDNSWIVMGGTGKSKFTNDAGETDWQDCHPGVTIFEIGGVYGDDFYALGKGKFFTNELSNFNLPTRVPKLMDVDELSIRYKSASIELVSSESVIEQLNVYSITGKLVSVYKPNQRTYKLLRSDFQPGMYILNTTINGKTHSRKIAFH